MTIKSIHTDRAPKAIGPYSQAIWAGNMLFLSGQIALDPATGDMKNFDVKTEATQAMANIAAILESQNLSWDNVVKTSIFLKDMDSFSEVNEVYASFFDGYYPARETVEVARLPKDARVEISIVALRST